MSELHRDASKTSSDGGSPCKEENFVDSLLSQVDEDNIDDIIRIQKKSYVICIIKSYFIIKRCCF